MTTSVACPDANPRLIGVNAGIVLPGRVMATFDQINTGSPDVAWSDAAWNGTVFGWDLHRNPPWSSEVDGYCINYWSAS